MPISLYRVWLQVKDTKTLITSLFPREKEKVLYLYTLKLRVKVKTLISLPAVTNRLCSSLCSLVFFGKCFQIETGFDF